MALEHVRAVQQQVWYQMWQRILGGRQHYLGILAFACHDRHAVHALALAVTLPCARYPFSCVILSSAPLRLLRLDTFSPYRVQEAYQFCASIQKVLCSTACWVLAAGCCRPQGLQHNSGLLTGPGQLLSPCARETGNANWVLQQHAQQGKTCQSTVLPVAIAQQDKGTVYIARLLSTKMQHKSKTSPKSSGHRFLLAIVLSLSAGAQSTMGGVCTGVTAAKTAAGASSCTSAVGATWVPVSTCAAVPHSSSPVAAVTSSPLPASMAHCR